MNPGKLMLGWSGKGWAAGGQLLPTRSRVGDAEEMVQAGL